MKVLFICNGNAFRSPVAEVLFNKMFAEHSAESAGMMNKYPDTPAGAVVPAKTLRILKGMGIDISKHICRVATNELMVSARYVFVMERRQKNELIKKFPKQSKKIFTLKEFAGYKDYNIPNAKSTNFQLRVYKQIKNVLERLKNEDIL